MSVPAKKAVSTRTSGTRSRGPARRTVEPIAPPAAVPRSLKKTRGRSGGGPPPTHIRVMGTTLGDPDRDLIARKLGTQLEKFASSIQRTTVRVTDVNGPRGGRDQVVRIKVVLGRQSSVVVEERGVTVQRVLGRAIKATVLAVKRRVRRRRMKPRRRPATQRRAGATS